MRKFLGISEMVHPAGPCVRGAGPRYAMAGKREFSEEIQACITCRRRSSVPRGDCRGEGAEDGECPILTRTVSPREGVKNRVC